MKTTPIIKKVFTTQKIFWVEFFGNNGDFWRYYHPVLRSIQDLLYTPLCGLFGNLSNSCVHDLARRHSPQLSV